MKHSSKKRHNSQSGLAPALEKLAGDVPTDQAAEAYRHTVDVYRTVAVLSRIIAGLAVIVLAGLAVAGVALPGAPLIMVVI